MKRSFLLLFLSLFFNLSASAADYSYQYDAAGRLISVSMPQSQTITYSYDLAGNVLTQNFSLTADTDSDSLPDEWEQTNFGSLEQTGEGDFDSDGFSNLSEYLAGTDPKAASSSLRIISIEPQNPGGPILMVASVAGKSYQIQSKNSLSEADWSNRDTVSATDSTFNWSDPSGNSATRFYRVVLLP